MSTKIEKNRVKELRLKAGLTLQELSNKTGIAKTTISNYERGVAGPKVNNAEKIAKVLDVSVPYLLGLTDINRPASITETKSNIDNRLNAIDSILETKPEHEQKDWLLKNKKALMDIRTQVQRAEKIESEITQKLSLRENLEKEVNDENEKYFKLALENFSFLYNSLSDENFDSWINLGHQILKSQMFDSNTTQDNK